MEKHINLQLGWPSPSLFPNTQLLDGASGVLQSDRRTASALIYGPSAGFLPLRERIAAWLDEFYRPSERISSERICVTNGASANLGNILAKFTEPGYTRNVWMVEPSYFLACPIFTDNGFEGRLRGIPEDDEGLDIAFLRTALESVEAESNHPAKPAVKTSARYPHLYKHVIYATPTFSNPSSKTMSLGRREELVRLARDFDAIVVTDDVYDVLRWPSSPSDRSELPPTPPRIVDVDGILDGGPRHDWGNAVSNGSFSKIIGPGVRTGWAEGTPSFVLGLASVGSTGSGGCPTHLAATFVEDMLSTGKLQAHIRDKLIPTYRSRYNVLLSAVERLLVPLGFTISTGTPYRYQQPSTDGIDRNDGGGESSATDVAGGYFIYVNIPTDMPIGADEMAALGLEKYNLKFAFGGMMVVEGDRGSTERASTGFGRAIRLTWAWHTEDEIAEGIERIATLVRDYRGI
ncbi:Aspartate/methionine/tyrosine aminotransferase [Geosmithia morbida]|uniref:Aspartate/methionine/tyrosine aminotransferase n=1 Tax=Geosmithia morbida TaxID=1094350 RepID=A0A9P5D2D9_9HYPO|nr:Aspartate/methionine/tyrosine aminotransferase [Geosmithia morbida]KAF4121381.1 Aspartate/methionine/tyrosine aminotransferase [Geosmithia morbida]